jgi:hypothetical protein
MMSRTGVLGRRERAHAVERTPQRKDVDHSMARFVAVQVLIGMGDRHIQDLMDKSAGDF